MEQNLTRGQQWLEQVLSLMGTPTSVQISYPQSTEETTLTNTHPWLVIEENNLNEEQVRALLKDQGRTLDSLQYLANTLLNLKVEEDAQASYTIEFKGYRQQREKELRVLAEKTAWQVLETGENVELSSLSGAERRQIHQFLQQYEGLESWSRGQEPDRRLVVQRKGNE
ncbi:single-stranded nucleic acid binding R3H domain-containing protein [Halothece sp. PCC 7418]|uniref:Jag family protein n=1 Tax=Halothece sp. (strain PCC 7418) TaxID=65093 RepID=UPI0002A08826|nr:R3H domain-containing nucleic acid-binding protein [Halothece sp. PCC 7418]AFZ43111.1 single-stranded nucleic acid binding R3H domain-containing protein [Halothece sp. PCC 7418]